MKLSFLPPALGRAIDCLNLNYLTEIRIRRGQPVIIEYRGEYVYVNGCGATRDRRSAICISDVDGLLNGALSGSVYAYAEQLKRSYVTLDGGVRIGIAGEYVTRGANIEGVRAVTSLNIRIPHDIQGCADRLAALCCEGPKGALIFSPPGYGKTTMLRDLARRLSSRYNVVVIDERGELSAADCQGDGYFLGERCDVFRGGQKLACFYAAIRAMKPQAIVTDELYGDEDFGAVKYAADCGIAVCASTHVTREDALKGLPFEYFCRLTGIGKEVIVYDKNFNAVRDNCGHDGDRRAALGR